MCERTRLEAVTKWLGWHLLELAAVIGTLVASVWLSRWFAVLSALVVALWAVQEWRAHRNRRQLLRGPDRSQLANTSTTQAETVRMLPREGA